ncbi:conserved hypothetical protein [Histoplasma capsulatum G186AR]|uniref:DUF4211 domain-containing protein n=2 Tax=Ajellomyces capsulatus TaxID=5037 RepID=C0NY02_AJECG|nr:uncharacterized protein HCBG_07796 [Histoplasma capsulatum G186AR]EEH03670.1 conserved hypothetical protein [Histoplasma capsulatum G186AR]KAG5293751.1 putative transcription factor IIIc-like protein, conidia-enriched transcript [Histoplasma capsulatum]QSS75203.1 putative transcription factor IIIc-like protein, conidia-enriched transcript [Histoplasma capsulatum G186AR]
MPPSTQPARKRNAKRQTRLTFTSLTSSSPGLERSPGNERVATMQFKNDLSSPSSSRRIVEKEGQIPSLFQSSEREDISSDEESIRAPSSSRRPLKRLNIEDMDEDDNDGEESEDIICSSPAKRRRLNLQSKGSKEHIPRNRAERDRLDLKEDLEDLRDSAVTKTRTRGRAADKAKLKRQTQLEALRRRRAGGKRGVISVESSGEESNAEQSKNGSSSEEEREEEEEEEEEAWINLDEDSDIEPASPEDLDKYEDDFVDQGEDGILGAPDELNDIPFEFTRHRYKRLRDHFKDVVEWMVHNKLNPAFPRDDVVYRVAFSKVNDEVMGLAGSQLISSAWNRDFRKALEARPGLDVTLYPISMGHSCDACNKTNHPASFDIKLDGKPYLLETLEPISDDDDEDSDSDEQDDDESGDHKPGNIDRGGNEIPDASTHFYLGRHCKTKAIMAHTLIHWRYHLNEWIVDYLQRKGIFSDAEILERERWSQKRRTKYANQVVDDMDEVAEINRLWRDFNTNLKAAREAKESRW